MLTSDSLLESNPGTKLRVIWEEAVPESVQVPPRSRTK